MLSKTTQSSSQSIGIGHCGYGGGYGGGMIGGGMIGGGMIGGGMMGGGASSSSLGIVPGAHVSCVSQIPSSQLVIQPAPLCVTIPGPILMSSGQMSVQGHSPCASGYGYGSSGYGYGSSGYGYGSGMGSSSGGYLGGGHQKGYPC